MATTTPTPQQLALLDSIVLAVTRSRRMRPEDIDDFRQTVHLKLAERGYDVLARFSGRSSLRTYLTVVVTRLLLDWQNHAMGKWRPAAAAVRLGPLAIGLDRLIDRDGYSVDQAVDVLCAAHPGATPAALRDLAARLPIRRRRQVVASELSELTRIVVFVDPVEAAAQARHGQQVRGALARALGTLPAADRRLIELRFRRRLTVREVARRLRRDPKPLYRHFERVLSRLQQQLLAQGVTRDTACAPK